MRSTHAKEKNKTKYPKILAILIVMIFLGVLLMLESFNQGSVISQSMYSYEINRNADYKVYIKENNFFDTNYLDKGLTYVSNLVDYVFVNFHYQYKIDKNADITYTYKVVNYVIVQSDATTTNKGELWSKEYVLINPTTINLKDQSSFEINQDINVDYNLYNTEVKNFKDTYNLPVSSYMEVKLQVYAQNNIDGVENLVSEQSIIGLKMNLLQDTFQIEENYKKEEENSEIKTQNIASTINQPLVIIGAIIIFISMVGIVNIVNKMARHAEKKDYIIALERILKRYEDRIIRIVTPVDIRQIQVIDVKNFEQLLVLEDEIRMPILFYETISNEKGEFLIMYDNIAYRYIINGKENDERKD